VRVRTWGIRLAWHGLATVWVGLVVSLVSSAARADVPSAIVIAKSSKPNSDLARVTSAVRDALEELELVELLPAPALDLEAAQLAIDCSEENARCLGELANRMEARVVIVPSVRKQSDGLELRLLAHDRSSSAAPALAMRKQAGVKLSPALLEAMPSMLREIHEAEEPIEPEAEAEQEEPEPSPSPAPTGT